MLIQWFSFKKTYHYSFPGGVSVWYMDIDTDVKFKAGGVDQKVSTRLDFSAEYRF